MLFLQHFPRNIVTSALMYSTFYGWRITFTSGSNDSQFILYTFNVWRDMKELSRLFNWAPSLSVNLTFI